MPITLEEMIRLAEQQAQRIMIGTNEELAPTWLMIDLEGNVEITATPWSNNEEKHLVTAAMREIMRKRQIVAYSLLVECWFALISEKEMGKEYIGPPPSERDDRREGVVVTAVHRDGRHLHRTFETVRDKGGACVELRRTDGPEDVLSSALFNNLLNQGRPN